MDDASSIVLKIWKEHGEPFLDHHDHLQKMLLAMIDGVDEVKLEQAKISAKQRQAIDIMFRHRFGAEPLPDRLPWVFRFQIEDYENDKPHIIGKNPLNTDPKWSCSCRQLTRCRVLANMQSALDTVFG